MITPIINTIFISYELDYKKLKGEEVPEIIRNAEKNGFKVIGNPYINEGYIHIYNENGELEVLSVGDDV